MSPLLLIIVNSLLSVSIVTLILMVQLLVYPSFLFYQEEIFPDAMIYHQSKISLIVMPFMILELITNIILVWKIESIFTWIMLIIVVSIWLTTFTIQVPLHEKLTLKKDDAQINSLVRSNWLRTILWSTKGVLAVILLMKSV